MKRTCSNCKLNVDRTCRAMPIVVHPASPLLQGMWPPVKPAGWCSWHKLSLRKFLRRGDGART